MKVKVKEMYTYSREINKNEDDFELPIIEGTKYCTLYYKELYYRFSLS